MALRKELRRYHCCTINSPSLREKVGVRNSDQASCLFSTSSACPSSSGRNVKLVHMFGNPKHATQSGYHTFVKDKYFHNPRSYIHNLQDKLFTKGTLD